jgi:hypothetical protein
MPPAIDYRQTFLRWHIPTELDPPFEQESGFREEVLALDSLRHRLRQSFPAAEPEIHRLVSRRLFFLNEQSLGMPDLPWVYLPVRVQRLPDGDRGVPRGEEQPYADLTTLLTATAKSGRNVLLTARSGAGKSTAMLKAFFDCLEGRREPPLGGFLPCYLRRLNTSRKSADHKMILRLLAKALRLPSQPTIRQLKQWLKYSPPLLLFMDLNAAPDELRLPLAEAIIRFQEQFKDKHRWVVAYRATGRDHALNYLTQTGRFGSYDLCPLEYTDAEKYLVNLQLVESELTKELAQRHPQAVSRPAATAPMDSAKLRALFDRYGNSSDALISTPLLMHFVAVIGIERATKAESLAQLYEEVVKDYLDRDYGRLDGQPTTPYREVVHRSGLVNPAGRTKIKVAMARVALATQATGATRLQRCEDASAEELLDDLLEKPEECRDLGWWSADPWWHGGQYFKLPFKRRRTRRALQEFSFLRRDGESIGFLHDSFLYYFAALAMRCRDKPLLGRSSLKSASGRAEWCRKAVERMHESPESWQLPALFLAGMLTPGELQDLLPPLLTAQPKKGWFGIVSQVVRGRRRPMGQEDVILREVELALHLRSTEMERYPRGMFPHIYNHLFWN